MRRADTATTRLRVVAALLAALLLVAACGGPPDDQEVAPGGLAAAGLSLEGVTYRVGGKEFDEQRVLCQIEIAVLSSVGADVVDQCGLVGTFAARQDLVDGEIDTYVEYTGTGWLTHLGRPEVVRDPVRQYELVRDADAANGVVWLPPAPMDNSYGIAVARATGERLGIRSLSDLARYADSGATDATLCVESEFAGRPDGFAGLLAAYGVRRPYTAPPAVTTQDVGATYLSVARGEPCTFGEVYGTDGRIPGLDLAILVDDRNFFPRYNPAPVIAQRKYDEAPQVAAVLGPVIAALDDVTIRELNRQVSVDGRDPTDVARGWLASRGFVGAGATPLR